MRSFETYRDEMKNGELPVDVVTAERSTTAHVALKKKLLAAPIEMLQAEAQRVFFSFHLPVPFSLVHLVREDLF